MLSFKVNFTTFVEKLENQLMHLSNVEADKKIMEETIECQREQLTNYSSELHRTRSRLEQLERLAQQLDIKMQVQIINSCFFYQSLLFLLINCDSFVLF